MRLYIITAIFALTIVGGVLLHLYDRDSDPVIQYQKTENRLAQLRRNRQIADIFWPTLAAIVLAAAAGGARWVWRESGKPTEVHAEAGLYPVLVMDKSTPRDRFAGLRRVLTHNPNTGESLSVVSTPDGAITAESSIQPDHHADHIQIARDVIGVQKTQAAASGMRAPKGPTVAEIKAQKGWYDNPPQRGGAQVIDNAPALPAPTQAPLTLADAMRQSSRDAWIVGQGDGGTPAIFRPPSHIHGGIVGSTGTGKTEVGLLFVAHALRFGFHPVILDPDEGDKDNWGEFSRHAERHETSALALPGQMEEMHRLFEARTVGANNRPVLLVIDEIGSMLRTLRTRDRNGAVAVEMLLGDILDRGRKRAIHVLLIDQYPELWTNQMLAGTKFIAAFQLAANQGAKVGEYKAHQLADNGEFLVRGQQYNSLHIRPALPVALRGVPPTQYPDVITMDARPVTAGTLAARPATQPAPDPSDPPVRRVRPPAPTPPTGEEQAANTPTNTNTNTPTNSQGGEWDEFAQRFFEKNPYATQTALARAMAGVDPEGRHYRRFVGGLSSGLFHQYSPNGDNYEGAPGREPEPVFAAEVEAYEPEPEPEPEPEQARPAGSRREPRLCTDSTGWIGHERVLSKDEWYESVRKLPIWWEEEE